MTQLVDLPNEIISHILNLLDSPSVFESTIHELPQSRPSSRPLKVLPLSSSSYVSHRFRKLVLPVLFRHVRMHHGDLKAFLRFAETAKVRNAPISIVIEIYTPTSHLHPPWWTQVLTTLPSLSTLSIAAPPHIFPEVTRNPCSSSNDAWAFKIRLQYIQLRIEHVHPFRHTSQSLLNSHPWTHLLVNESSSLRAYTTYEYFLRSTPTPIPSTAFGSSDLRHYQTFLPLLTNLRSFTLISIFPFSNHLASHLTFIRLMTSLHTLTLRLLPTPQSTVLASTIEATGGHFDVRDPWNEFETSLPLVIDTVKSMSMEIEEDGSLAPHGMLGRLIMCDVEVGGVRDLIETSLRAELPGWGAGGRTWLEEVEGDARVWIRTRSGKGND